MPELLEAFEADDGDALLLLLTRATEVDRAAAWDAALPHFRPRRWHAEYAALDDESRRRRTRTQALFCLAAGPPDVARSVGGFVFGFASQDEAEFAAVLGLRTPSWRRDFAASSLSSWARDKEVGLLGPWWWENWRRIRHLGHSGVVPFDEHSAEYLVALVRGLTFSDSIEDALRADPALLRERVWDLFEPAEGVQRALMGGDRYWDPANTWRPALVRLALSGHLDAGRLRAEADRAAADERMRRNQQAWYRGIVTMLDDPSVLPTAATAGPPLPGNRLQRWSGG